MIAVRLTSRGRVTIPKEIREHLKLKPGDRVFFVLRHGEVVMQAAVPSLLQMRGSIKPRHEPEDLGAVRSQVRREMARRRASRSEQGPGDE
jgi:AbrB family looped-hinge helix DNA binding protein